MHRPLKFVLYIWVILVLFGCAAPEKQAEESSVYVPYKDRPPIAKEYWERRGKQDEIDRRIEERTQGR